MIRRLCFFAVLVGVFVVGSGAAAGADELNEVLARQAEAVFSGEQTVVCATPDGTRSEVFEVGQSDGLVVTRSATGVYRTNRMGDEESWAALGDYEAVPTVSDQWLGRRVQVVELRSQGTVRAVLSIDNGTGVVLASDVLNADGSSYCSTRFTRFTPGDAGLAASVAPPESGQEAIEATTEMDTAFPTQLAGFARQSISEGSEPTILSAYYVDGLFSFTLLNSPRPIDVPELRDAPVVAADPGEYRRTFDVGSVVYSWQSETGGYVLVGDLPLDLQESVLAELPSPESSGFFSRLWKGLFD